MYVCVQICKYFMFLEIYSVRLTVAEISISRILFCLNSSAQEGLDPCQGIGSGPPFDRVAEHVSSSETFLEVSLI